VHSIRTELAARGTRRDGRGLPSGGNRRQTPVTWDRRSLLVERHDHLLRRLLRQRQPEGPVDVGDGHPVADEPGEALVVLDDLGGDLEDLGLF
jgi:hypothetical protein